MCVLLFSLLTVNLTVQPFGRSLKTLSFSLQNLLMALYNCLLLLEIIELALAAIKLTSIVAAACTEAVYATA